MMRRAVPAIPAQQLPLQLETIGKNPDQETLERPDGYPCFHWLQTVDGEGELVVNGQAWRLPACTGVLLAPGIAHRYEAKCERWQTAYITFQGNMAAGIIQSFGWNQAERFQWDAQSDHIAAQLLDMLTSAESSRDPSGWQYSADLYRFLTLLRTIARTTNRASMSTRLERVQGLLDFLDHAFVNPELGLAEMAAQLSISQRQLNERFRELFGQTAYAYLIQLRLRKAKEWLPARPDWSVRRIGEAVGFRDASHFVATFRQKEGMTPETYRRLHVTDAPHP